VLVGETPLQVVAIGPRRALVLVPETAGGELEVRLQSGSEISEPARLVVARKLAGDLHPVANPAFDPDDGALFVTRSGSRGEELPVTLFRIDVSGELTEYSGDIPNPTGIAFAPDGQMFVTSRLEGVVYKITPFKEAVAFARTVGMQIVINDRADIALAVGADGVHLGQDDLSPVQARQLLGDQAVIGFSTHSVDQARGALELPIDYIAMGPVFETSTKSDHDPVVGLDGLRSVRDLIGGFPLVAIGGITTENAELAFEAGADCVPFISELISDPQAIPVRMRRLIESSR
jgi:thiamine-phosphate pyrophosphorylase